jgi:hypothetical protein
MDKTKQTLTVAPAVAEETASPAFLGNGRVVAAKQSVVSLFVKKGANVAACCAAIGVTRRTFDRWYADDDTFRAAINEQRESLIDFAESQLYQLIAEKNVPAILFFLKCKAKDRGYIERQEIDHTSKGQPLATSISIVVHGSSSNLLAQAENLQIKL